VTKCQVFAIECGHNYGNELSSIDIVAYGVVPNAHIPELVPDYALQLEKFVMYSIKGIAEKLIASLSSQKGKTRCLMN
jgi:hypothetical protein